MKTTDPMAAKVSMFKEATLEARENLATQLLNPETISQAMARAAALGHNAVRIDGKGVDLRQTKAAAALLKRLKAAGAEYEWEQRVLEPAHLRYADLIISW